MAKPTKTQQIFTHLEKLHSKVDKIDDRLNSTNTTLAVQAVTLKEHVRRTYLAEKRLDKIDEDLKPVNAHISRIQGLFKLLALIGSFSALIIVGLRYFLK